MKPIVLDASVAGAWVLPQEPNAATLDLYSQARTTPDLFHAPALWLWEIGNLLVMGHQSRRIDAEMVEQGLEVLSRAQVQIDTPPNPHRQAQVARLALTHGLSCYDAAYLELVLRLNGQLASLDAALLKAARSCGIVCLAF